MQADLVFSVAADDRLADFESLAHSLFDADALSDRSPASSSPYHSKYAWTIASPAGPATKSSLGSGVSGMCQ